MKEGKITPETVTREVNTLLLRFSFTDICVHGLCHKQATVCCRRQGSFRAPVSILVFPCSNCLEPVLQLGRTDEAMAQCHVTSRDYIKLWSITEKRIKAVILSTIPLLLDIVWLYEAIQNKRISGYLDFRLCLFGITVCVTKFLL